MRMPGRSSVYDAFVRGKPVTLTGNDILGGVGTPMAGTVDVTRTDAQYPGGRFIGTATAGANGDFRFVDTPEVGGDVTYRLTPDVTGTT